MTITMTMIDQKLQTKFNNAKKALNESITIVHFGSNSYDIPADKIKIIADKFTTSEIAQLKKYATQITLSTNDFFMIDMFAKMKTINKPKPKTTTRKKCTAKTNKNG